MALPRQPETEQPLTEGSLAVDPRAAVSATSAAKPIPFPDRRRAEPTEPSTGDGVDLGRRRFLKGVFVVTAGTAAGVAGYNPIRSFLEGLGSLVSAEAPNFFDNKARGGSIGKNNTMAVSAEAANNILAKEKSKGNATDTTLLFPFILPDGSKEIGYGFQTRSKGFDPKTGKNMVEDMRSWMLLPKVPGKTIVVAPIDADVFAYTKKDGMVQGIGMEFTIEENAYTLKIGGTTLSEIFKDLNNLPTLRQYQNNQGRVHFERGTPLLRVQESGAEVQMSLISAPVESSKNEENPVDINFLSTLDETGIRKLVVLSN